MDPQKGTALLLMVALMCAACSEGEPRDAAHADEANGLTAAQLTNGIGPVSELELGPLDATLAAKGAEIFVLKCSACHKQDARYVGPALGGVLERRAPAYVMNMVLNPAEMVERHPDARKLLAEYMVAMPNQNMTREEARAIVEYLRSWTTGTAANPEN